VVSFGRCIFKLNSDSVGHLLQAALGGFATGFEVLQLADLVFRFLVSSMAVGFHIYNSRYIDRKEFRAFFNLWNHGGPNWKREFKNFSDEEAASWQKVRGKKSLSFADIVRLPLTGANAIPIRNNVKFSGGHARQARASVSVFSRLGAPPSNLAPVHSARRFPAGGLHQPHPRISAFNRLGLPSSSSRRGAYPLGFRALTPLAKSLAAEFTTVPIFKIRILIGLGFATSNGVPFGLGGLLGCWARRPFAVSSVRCVGTWNYFAPLRNLPSVFRWPHFLPLGVGPFWCEIENLRTSVPGFAPPWCLCPVDRLVTVASRSSPGRYY
jgi:hypothetical protein